MSPFLSVRRVAAMTIALLMVPSPAIAGSDGLDRSLRAITEAGMYGVYSSVRDGDRTWRGASGVADVQTGRPVRPGMVHRIGSVTKAFTAVAVLRQVDRGTIGLDTPVSTYLPGLVTDARITVRMLLNHTSHIPDYLPQVFPSTVTGSPESLEANRFRKFTKKELAGLGLGQPRTGEPGAEPGTYSNTNYILAGLILERVTGRRAEEHITRDVIHRAGLRHTSFPRTPYLPGPHSKAYTSIFGMVDPPGEYSVYDMSWASTAGAVIATMDDLNRFFAALLGGELLSPVRMAEMRETVRVGRVRYGLGIFAYDLPCGRHWGTDGGVFGMGTRAVSSSDGRRQMSFGTNRTWYQRLNDDGGIEPHPIDDALVRHTEVALCGLATG